MSSIPSSGGDALPERMEPAPDLGKRRDGAGVGREGAGVGPGGGGVGPGGGGGGPGGGGVGAEGVGGGPGGGGGGLGGGGEGPEGGGEGREGAGVGREGAGVGPEGAEPLTAGGDRVPAAVGAARARRQLITTIKDSLRGLSSQLSQLNHQVSARVDLKDVDLHCLDLLARHGPLSPTALARRAGPHPPPVTGLLDRLQRGGWVVRDRDPDASDGRAVTVRPMRERGAELYRLYSGMNASLDEICAGYTEPELELLAGFLRRTTDAGQAAAADLATS